MGALLAPVQTENSLATQIPASVPWALPGLQFVSVLASFTKTSGLHFYNRLMAGRSSTASLLASTNTTTTSNPEMQTVS